MRNRCLLGLFGLLMVSGLCSCRKGADPEEVNQVLLEHTHAIQNERRLCNRELFELLDELRKSSKDDPYRLSHYDRIEFILRESEKDENATLRSINRTVAELE